MTLPCVQCGVQPYNRSGSHNTVTKKEKHGSSLCDVLTLLRSTRTLRSHAAQPTTLFCDIQGHRVGTVF
ncbi:hypothetical protein SFMTTN_2518 [Sulfuriferula multivorans]|uniref:Uncharacterized protein n=1 Tax=Sulfuriferula multivorans TaxID=1559896 RepID=A0A401JGH9_9PROT|nr:hypothetical protein SFMTTN_2518 [Sulfuriferula multivorans]